MAKAIAVLLFGLGAGLAGLILWSERSEERGAAHAEAGARQVDGARDARREAVELRTTPPTVDPRTALPHRASHEPAAVDLQAALPPEAVPTRVEDGRTTRAFYADGSLEFEGGQTLAANGLWVREGPWRAWHENGQLHELGAYHQGEETGFWRWWYENGERMAEGRFEAGERDGFWTYWHENGALMTECTYRAGKAHGLWTQFHPDGFKTAQGTFENGELAGEWMIWKEDGTLNLEGTGSYAAGSKVGE